MPGPGDRGGVKERPKDTKGALRRILGYLMQYRWAVVILLLCALISNLGNLLGPRFAGKAIGEAIVEQRIACAKDLLRDRSIPIDSIYFKCGYRSNGSLRKAFRRVTGMSLREWRDGCSRRSGE